MTEEQTNEMMLMMEQLAGDVRELTYAIRTMAEVMERRERRIAPTQIETQAKIRNRVMGGVG